MNDVEFNEPVSTRSVRATEKKWSISGMVVKMGLAKDEQQAEQVLLVLTVLLLVGIVALWLYAAPQSDPTEGAGEPVAFGSL